MKTLAKLLAYHYYESGKKYDWYTWASLTLSATVLILVSAVPIVYFAFKKLNVDFDVKYEMRTASMITAAIIFCIVRLCLFIFRRPLLEQCSYELEHMTERNLRSHYFRIGLIAIAIAVIMILITGLFFRK